MKKIINDPNCVVDEMLKGIETVSYTQLNMCIFIDSLNQSNSIRNGVTA